MSKFWIFLTAAIVALGILFFATKKDDPAVSSFTGDAKKVLTDDHVIKAPNEKAVLIEYGDFQCPACGVAYQPLKQAKAQFKDQVTFVFRHLPLTQIHPNAFAAARAAEAAGNQNKFFEMHDKLYETQSAWGEVATNQQSLFEGYAEELGLDMPKFKSDYASEAVANRINRDVATAKNTFNATGTPTFILNGNKIENPASSFEAYSKLLSDAITKAGGTPSTTNSAQ